MDRRQKCSLASVIYTISGSYTRCREFFLDVVFQCHILIIMRKLDPASQQREAVGRSIVFRLEIDFDKIIVIFSYFLSVCLSWSPSLFLWGFFFLLMWARLNYIT